MYERSTLRMEVGTCGARSGCLCRRGQRELKVLLAENIDEAIKTLPAGKHTFRLARYLDGGDKATNTRSQARVVSQPVIVEVTTLGLEQAKAW